MIPFAAVIRKENQPPGLKVFRVERIYVRTPIGRVVDNLVRGILAWGHSFPTAPGSSRTRSDLLAMVLTPLPTPITLEAIENRINTTVNWPIFPPCCTGVW